ncbi:hypothetical protein BV25DRAFT_1825626 [Artomyces pyxidatus]|uniref:Uncharacterized protein n=1 Tax=Artomyces pyxidatus TaxID=48021 RepID=A0ACB8T1E0_9AGAM|nr:hypothetical protein BV25DRAFT_1825626 [Artomyces pyxidatus]
MRVTRWRLCVLTSGRLNMMTRHTKPHRGQSRGLLSQTAESQRSIEVPSVVDRSRGNRANDAKCLLGLPSAAVDSGQSASVHLFMFCFVDLGTGMSVLETNMQLVRNLLCKVASNTSAARDTTFLQLRHDVAAGWRHFHAHRDARDSMRVNCSYAGVQYTGRSGHGVDGRRPISEQPFVVELPVCLCLYDRHRWIGMA